MNPHLSIQTNTLDLPAALYSDSRTHTPQGPNVRVSVNRNVTRNVRLPRATPSGGSISRSEDGRRCAVAGTEYLRIIRVSDPEDKAPNAEHKSALGAGGYRLDASRNMWEGSGLKIDSAITDVAWCHGLFNHKVLTSARNGDLIMWDLNKTGASKYERKTKDHSRSVHKLAVSHIVTHYSITGSAEGDLRVWDIRDMGKSIMRIHHPTSVRGVAFSPSPSQPLQAIVGLDNGSIYRRVPVSLSFFFFACSLCLCRWELRMGQRGMLDRLPVAHTASVTSLDWRLPDSAQATNEGAVGLGWVVSAGLDRCVKIWDLTQPNSSTTTSASAAHIPHRPTYTLHSSFPIRHVLWRPGYECEVAVVSNANAEFGSSNFSELAEPAIGPTYASVLGVGAARAGAVSSPSLLVGNRPVSAKEGRERGSGIGDAVEIWDARRGWIAKWTVRGSAIEGGVTDIAFRDSHAIWATHSSGMFSQIDLREASKPVDAIPRMAATWEASGSLTFVADKRVRWEVPYDDVPPGLHLTAEDRKIRKLVKSIGDPPCKPDTQVVGTYASESLADDIDVFTKLAKTYIFEGQDRQALCEMNARTAFEAGKVQVSQAWLLLASCLTSLVPELPPTPQSPPPPASGALSVPTIASNYAFPPVAAEAGDTAPGTNSSPGRNSSQASPREFRNSATSSRKLTPTSSSASSPRLQVGSLPAVTPRPPSRPYMGRRQSGDSGVGSSRRPSHYRKPSMGLPNSASPSNTRHIGEGVLDDSDSSSSGSAASTGVDVGDEMTMNGEAPSSDEDSAMVSPSFIHTRQMTASHPSPLSKVQTLHQWSEHDEQATDNAEEEEEASSPSPMSTDSDKSSDEDQDRELPTPRRHQKSKSRGSGSRKRTRLKSRSRSSTLASLAAPALSHTLIHQTSRSSILTVTAGETSFHDNNVPGLKAEETLRDVRPIQPHEKSEAVSNFVSDQKEVMLEGTLKDVEESHLTERRLEFIHADEDIIREMTWEVLREALESFADEGDLQTCAMFAMIAPQELHIKPPRVLRFLESYIDILTRLQLHTCAAYVRKYCQSEPVRNHTLLETLIYTSCGKCRKPLVMSAGTPSASTLVKGGFAFCLACKAACVSCAICRLPVRTLLFQCSICHHGGHQACFRRYYMEHPLIPIPNNSSLFPSAESRGRSRGRTPDTVSTDVSKDSPEIPFQSTQITQARLGHPCVSGCGHWCWAATEAS
ncbi:WD-repeats-region domain-containing protein [Favolaschia claudopus]|uniref:WD-repeats-region domain-containing protein n=1 Tax=Favolaschia claudopus TaxID=2862362 RepID=A0AAW0B3D3_9AGAR